MNWRLAFTEAVAAVRFHRRRAIVSVLSIGWGVTCFLVLMSYGDGFQETLTRSFTAVGQHLVLTGSGQTSEQAGGMRAGRRVRIRYSDAVVVKESVPQIALVSPEIIVSDSRVVRGAREAVTAIRAVWPEYGRIRNQHINQGRWISREDDMNRRRVVVLGFEIAREVFRSLPPVGEDVRVNGIRFTVIGVLKNKLQLANYVRRDSRCVFIPYSTVRIFSDADHPDLLAWSPADPAATGEAMQALRTKLAEIHHFSPSDQSAVEMYPFSQFIEVITSMNLAVRVLLLFVGALTLGIGGVGVANIMLAAVVDRTREIGMLKALGARKRNILAQFLAETGLIICCGGVVGLLLGGLVITAIGSMPLLGPLQESAGELADIQLRLSLSSVAISLGVLLLIGLVAGMAPAIKAARLDPIEALRYE